MLLLLSLRHAGYWGRVRHRHRRTLPRWEAGGVRGVQGEYCAKIELKIFTPGWDDLDIIGSINLSFGVILF